MRRQPVRIFRATPKLLAAIEMSRLMRHEIAIKAGVSPADLSKLAGGYFLSSAEKPAQIARLCRVLGVSVAEGVQTRPLDLNGEALAER